MHLARCAPHASLAGLKREIVIAGGGLAGLSLAAGLLRRGVAVEVHEAGGYPRHRVCGEFISGVARETLERLGVAGAFSGALLHRSVAWWREGRLIHEDALPEPALGISRHLLDRRLCGIVRDAGGTVIEHSRLRREPRPGLVWAAGRVLAKSPWIGLKCHVRGLAMHADLEMHLGANGYAGLAGVEGGAVNVCGLFRIDRSLKASGAGLLLEYLRAGGNGRLADRILDSEIGEDSFTGVAGFLLGRQTRCAGLCALGDAESMIPPFTGNGMSMAFQAAESALDPLASWSSGEVGWDTCVSTVEERLRKRFRRRLAAADFMHAFLLRPAGRRFLEGAARTGALPFRPLLSLVR